MFYELGALKRHMDASATVTEMPYTSERKASSPFLKVGIALAVVAVLVGILWWWSNRPITPVVLTEPEKAVLQEKVETLNGEETARPEPVYEKGLNVIQLTERELNGLIHQHTTLGDTLKLELATDAVHARIETELDQDLPVFGGKTLKAKARVAISMRENRPSLVLEDLTVWGISMPNDWLGGLKGKDFLHEIFGGEVALSGVKEVEVRNGGIFLELKD